jgi:hypothetical protein
MNPDLLDRIRAAWASDQAASQDPDRRRAEHVRGVLDALNAPAQIQRFKYYRRENRSWRFQPGATSAV